MLRSSSSLLTSMPGTVHRSAFQLCVSQTLNVLPGVAANNLEPCADQRRRLTPPPPTRRTGANCSLATLQISMVGSAGDPEARSLPAGCHASAVTGAWPSWVRARTQLVLGRDTTLAGSRVHSIMPTRHPTASSAEPQGFQDRQDMPR